MTKQEFERLPRVRVTNNAGPCLTSYRLVRRNRVTATVAFRNGEGYSIRSFSLGAIHRETCSLCPGERSYPNGYMD